MTDRLLWWVVVRTLVPLVLVAAWPNQVGDWLAYLSLGLDNPHDRIKSLIFGWHGILLRQDHLMWAMAVGAGASVGLTFLRGRRWEVAVVLVLIGGLLAPRYATWPLLLGVVLVAFAGLPLSDLQSHLARCRRLSWWPGTLWCLPAVVGAALGTTSKPWLHRMWVGLFGAVIGFGWVTLDGLANLEVMTEDMEQWPDDQLDSRVRVLAHADPGMRAEWHGVQIVGGHALVTAEMSTRLFAFPLDDEGDMAVVDFSPRLGPSGPAPLNSVTDPQTGLTWLIDQGRTLVELQWDGQEWAERRRMPFGELIDKAYLHLDGNDLRAVAVQTAGRLPRLLMTGTLPALSDLKVSSLRHGTTGVPMPREFAWVPSIGRLVLSPDFGSRLWLADPETGQVEPWLETPTLDGKLRWSKSLDRIVLTLPNRLEMWVIDPHTGTVDWTIRTQPGVRSIALDEDRGLVVTASVLSGQVWVQDIRTGQVLDRFGGFMPMVRELALSETRGEAVLTTWATTYAFSYVPQGR